MSVFNESKHIFITDLSKDMKMIQNVCEFNVQK